MKVKEDISELKVMMSSENDKRKYERLQSLYLKKKNPKITQAEIADILCKNRDTISRWQIKYKKGGLTELLTRNTSEGRPGQLSPELMKELKEQLESEKGFASYYEVIDWLKETHQIEMTYDAIFWICHKRLGASLKSVRKRNPEQDPKEVSEFKKKSLQKKSNRIRI